MSTNIFEIVQSKTEFINQLSTVVCGAGNTYKKLEYKYTEKNGTITSEIVTITCGNNYTYDVDVYGDSQIAMMKDIAHVMLQHM